jgi:uncharacterized hydrophobic protein (TIGR00271 family)
VLHVRAVVPPEETGRVMAVLAANPGVHNLVLVRGAAQRPAGDAVQFDVQNGSANPVLRQLQRLPEGGRGSVTVDEGSVALDAPATPLDERRQARRERVPVWAVVEGTIRANASYPPSFYVLLVAAALIAAVGILTNSQILVVGAMVVGPEYFAIIAVALGLSKAGGHSRGWTSVRVALSALLAGFTAAIVVTFFFGLAVRAAGEVPAAFRAGVRPVAELINSPNAFSVIVAVLAGIVGVVSLTESRANALIGVFISITTIPAAASAGLSVAFASWHDAAGSLLQLVLNVVILIAVGAAGLTLQRAIWRRLAGPDGGRTAGPGAGLTGSRSG